jgi:hypothetical protein
MKLHQEAVTINKITIPQKRIHFKLLSISIDPRTSIAHQNDHYVKDQTQIFVLQPNLKRIHNQRIVITNHYSNAKLRNSKSLLLLYQD